MATGDQSVHLNRGDQKTELNEQQIKRMIDYLTEHTDYKILTNDEYQILKPVAHSTPSVARERGGARPKDQIRNVKFEDQSHMQNQLMGIQVSCMMRQMLGLDLQFFPGKKNPKRLLRCGKTTLNAQLEMAQRQQA